MPLTFAQLEGLLRPDDSGRIVVAGTAFETPAIATLWTRSFFPSSGTLTLLQARSASNPGTQTVTIAGTLATGVLTGVSAGQVTTGVFVLRQDGTVDARLEIRIGDSGWKLATTFPVLQDSVLQQLTFAAPVMTVDSTAPVVLPTDFRQMFGQAPDIQPGQHRLELGVLERVAVVLVDDGLALVRAELRDDAPLVAALGQPLVAVLHPDHRHLLASRALDQPVDVSHDAVALVRPFDDAVLHVDDKKCGLRTVLQRGHADSSFGRNC